MKTTRWGILAVLVFMVAAAPVAKAEGVRGKLNQNLMAASLFSGDDECAKLPHDIHRGGGEGPFPFDVQYKFELADGEKYEVMGTVKSDGENTALFIDFQSQPWLASKSRLAEPFYLVTAGAERLAPGVGKCVRVAVQAKTVVVTSEGRPYSAVTLKVIADPVIHFDNSAK